MVGLACATKIFIAQQLSPLTGERVFTYTRAMSKKQLISVLRVELAWINRLIDQRIVRGLSYGQLARRHRQLLGQLSRV